MRKKMILIFSVLLIFIIIVSIVLTNKPEEITVSEMLENVVSETEGNVYIYYGGTPGWSLDYALESGKYISEFDTVKYDGVYFHGLSIDENRNPINDYTVSFSSSKYLDESISEQISNFDVDDSHKINVFIYAYDESQSEDYDYSESMMGVWGENNGYGYGDVCKFYDNFFHITIDGDSYMVFDSEKNRTENVSHVYTIIKDTEYTKDKVVVSDDYTSERIMNEESLYHLHNHDDE